MKYLIKCISLIVLLTTIVTSIPINASERTFLDVSENHWAKEKIYFVTGKGILDPGGNYFHPNEYVTRAEAVKALYQFIHGMPAPALVVPFTDIPSNYAEYIWWAYYKGITSGTTATTFSPNRNVTKEDMCLLIANAYSAYDISFTKDRSYNDESFVDTASVSWWQRKRSQLCTDTIL